MRADLHLHSTASDGLLSADRLLEAARAAGLDLIAITDHDSVDAAEAALRLQPESPRVLAGVELSLSDLPKLHLLGYGKAPGPRLSGTLSELRRARQERAAVMLEKLAAAGLPLDPGALPADRAIGRPHIARALVAAGYAPSVPEAFVRWIGEGRPCYVPCRRMTMKEALALLSGEGWIPVLAHPRLLCQPDPLLETLIARWAEQGLRGIEVWHPSAAARGFEPLLRMADRRGLLTTGGSDFHAADDSRHGQPGCMTGAWTRMDRDVDRLLEAVDAAAAQKDPN